MQEFYNRLMDSEIQKDEYWEGLKQLRSANLDEVVASEKFMVWEDWSE